MELLLLAAWRFRWRLLAYMVIKCVFSEAESFLYHLECLHGLQVRSVWTTWRTIRTSTRAQKPLTWRSSPSHPKACSWLQPTGTEAAPASTIRSISNPPPPPLQGRSARLWYLPVERRVVSAPPEHQHSAGPSLETLHRPGPGEGCGQHGSIKIFM